MSARDTGPPEWERPRDRQEAGPDQRSETFQQSVYCYAAGLRRRGAAADDMPPLACGRHDPWWYEPPRERAYEQAAMHLLDSGLMPAPNREGLLGMHRSGGVSRKAAQRIARAWGWRHDQL
jgi:hypothetical protein